MHGFCVYCGKPGVLTIDHIPPKSLFPKEAHGYLLKVPSCDGCNRGASKDDEYLRTMIALSGKGERTKSLDVLSAAAIRSFARPEAAGFRESILRGVREEFVPGPAGLYIQAFFGDADLSRFDRVIARIVKGIFFSERGAPLRSDYKIVSYSMAGLTKMPAKVGLQLQALIEALIAGAPKQIAGPEFMYWSDYNSTDINQSLWMIVIHQHHFFIGWTVKRA